MAETNQTQKGLSSFWEQVGKVSTLIALIGGAIAIYSWFQSPGTELTGEVAASVYVVPPEVESFRDAIDRAIVAENISELVLNSGYLDDQKLVAQIAKRLSVDLQEQIDREKRSSARGYTRFWRTTIRNDGDLPLKDVSLRAPDANTTLIRYDNATSRVDADGPIVEVGNLAPGQSVVLDSWGENIFFPGLDFDKFSLYHSGGRGNLTLAQDSVLASFVSSPAVPILLCLLVLMGATVYQSGLHAGSRSIRKPQYSPPV